MIQPKLFKCELLIRSLSSIDGFGWGSGVEEEEGMMLKMMNDHDN